MTEPIAKEKLLEQAKRLLDEGRVDRAIQEYQKIVAADPRDYRVRLRIAELYVRSKQMPQAVKVYQEVAAAYADEGFYLKAVTVYKNILRINPSLWEINRQLADLYEKMGLAQDAVHQYQILANVYEQRGNVKSLVEIRRRIVALDPMNATNRVRLAEVYQLEGQDAASLQEYEALAEQLKEGGATEQLVDLYEKILARRPDHLDLLQRLCRIYYRQGEHKKALKRMEASQAVVATNPELLDMQAEIYFRLNQAETAKGKWRELAELHSLHGAVEPALAACERILTIAPDEGKTLAEFVEGIEAGAFAKVQARATARRHAMAQEESEREALETARQQAAAQIASEGPPVSAAAASKVPAAAPAVSRSASLSPTEAETLLTQARAGEDLGRMYQQMGLADEAAHELRKALDGYRRLLVAGIGGTDVLDRVRELEQRVPEQAATDEGRPAARVQGPAPKPVERRPRPEPPKGPGPGAKKRISFV